ncbi:protein TIFY 4B-like isoform X3 [Typha latifolia]|uniref:protein TIFY 4B-like isoform X3 n=1 Tax=Typha latifolia TaxID=4733 RepID=UPI003C2B371C
MSGGDTATLAAAKSVLNKPLRDLTEEDIAQLTREDCRRFLKEKGMRRPSWNKSQAIQQVISLKALFEGRPETGARQKHQPLVSLSSPPNEAVGASPIPYRRRGTIPPLFAADASRRGSIADTNCNPPENHCSSPRVVGEILADQMTIFYDGKINVYDGVAPDKVRAIMQLAASRESYEFVPGPVYPSRAPPPRFPTPTAFTGSGCAGKLVHHLRESLEWSRSPLESEPAEGPTSRKASLKRYLEKKKDRFKGKRVVGGSALSMDTMHLSQKFRCPPIPNQQSNMSDTNSPRQPKPPSTPTRCSSAKNQTKQFCLSVDLNDDACEANE